MTAGSEQVLEALLAPDAKRNYHKLGEGGAQTTGLYLVLEARQSRIQVSIDSVLEDPLLLLAYRYFPF